MITAYFDPNPEKLKAKNGRYAPLFSIMNIFWVTSAFFEHYTTHPDKSLCQK